MGFRKDLAIGKIGENLVVSLLEQCGCTCKSVDQVDKSLKSAYDIEVTPESGKAFTVEVKYDAYSEISGNLCVEYFNPKLNKPSGVYSSKAELYCYIIPDGLNKTVWIISTSRLRTFIKDEIPLKNLERVGDGNASVLLYKFDHILPSFSRIDNLSCDEIKSLIKKLLKEN